MANNVILKNILFFILLVCFQVLICDQIRFSGYINPYPYILFVLFYPLHTNRGIFLILAFLLGLAVDIFNSSGGINAAAAVFIAYIRQPFLILLLGKSDYEDYSFTKTKKLNFGRLIFYIAILTFIHHLILFNLEVFRIDELGLAMSRTLLSGIFTCVLCVIMVMLFAKKE